MNYLRVGRCCDNFATTRSALPFQYYQPLTNLTIFIVTNSTPFPTITSLYPSLSLLINPEDHPEDPSESSTKTGKKSKKSRTEASEKTLGGGPRLEGAGGGSRRNGKRAAGRAIIAEKLELAAASLAAASGNGLVEK